MQLSFIDVTVLNIFYEMIC